MKSCYLLLIFIINGQILGSEFTAATNESNIFNITDMNELTSQSQRDKEVISSFPSFNEYLKFCVIRNPYDKMVSAYFFLQVEITF